MKALRTAAIAAFMLAISIGALAGDSEMQTPLPSGNVWSNGKTSFSGWLTSGETKVGVSGFAEDGSALRIEYDDTDWGAGLRYSHPISDSFNLEVAGSYFTRETEADDPFAILAADADAFDDYNHLISVTEDHQKQKDWALAAGVLYTLAADADSPIRGGIGASLEYRRTEIDYDVNLVDHLITFGEDHPFETSFELYKAQHVTPKVFLTADIHLIRDKLRVTPMVGYYYRFRDIDELNGFQFWRNPETCDELWSLLDRTTDNVTDCEIGSDGNPLVLPGSDSDRGGGALYGLEVGFRPGGEDGKLEFVLTPFFQTEERNLSVPTSDFARTSRKAADHRDAITLMVRWFM